MICQSAYWNKQLRCNDQYIVQMLWNHLWIYFLFCSFTPSWAGSTLETYKEHNQTARRVDFSIACFTSMFFAHFNGAAALKRWLCLWYKFMYACIMIGGKPFWLFCWIEMSGLQGGLGCTYFSLAQWNR